MFFVPCFVQLLKVCDVSDFSKGYHCQYAYWHRWMMEQRAYATPVMSSPMMSDAMHPNSQEGKGLVIKQPGQNRINLCTLIRLQFENERILPHGCR
jgi:hypothetical protein